MNKPITEETIVTIFEVSMDYVYTWGLEVPITDALSEISKKEKEDGYTATYHICIGNTGLNRICSIAMNNIRYDEDNCYPDVQTVSDLLTKKGLLDFNITGENWSLEKSLLYAGKSKSIKLSITYDQKLNDITLDLENPLYFKKIYNELIKDLDEFKTLLSSDLTVDMTINAIDRTVKAKSRSTDNTYSGHYTDLDSDTICYWFHEVAIMDNAFIWLEEFSTEEPIIVPIDEEFDGDFDE